MGALAGVRQRMIDNVAKREGGDPSNYEISKENIQNPDGKVSWKWSVKKKQNLSSGQQATAPMTAGEQKTFLGRSSTLLGG